MSSLSRNATNPIERETDGNGLTQPCEAAEDSVVQLRVSPTSTA